MVQGKLCNVIIDGGSCTNVVSTEVITKLGLKTQAHPNPYSLQWMNENNVIKVEQQIVLSFSIGRYHDDVLCDVVPMEVTHVLLGRPWQSDRKAIHDGYRNRYTFVHHGRKVILASMTPKQIHEERERKMREKKEKEQKEILEKEEERTTTNEGVENEKGKRKMEENLEGKGKEQKESGKNESKEKGEKQNFFCKGREVEKL